MQRLLKDIMLFTNFRMFMKKFLKYAAIVLVFSVPIISLAAEFRSGDQPSVRQEEKITNDVYMAGGSVTSAGLVDGDLISGGGTVVISGNVSGDVFAGGGNVNIISNIGDDVRAGGGTVIISGKVEGDLIVGGGQINIGGSGIGGDAILGGGSIRIDAPIAGDVKIGGGTVYINSSIGGNVKIEADEVKLGSSAVISGNLTYKAKTELIKEEGAVIKGEVKFEPRVASKGAFLAIFSAFLLWKFFALLACALLIGMIFRRYSAEIVALAAERPLYEVGRGIVVMIVMPIASILLLVTLVGIPFGVVGLIGFIAIMLFAWIIAPIILGSVVYKYFSKKALEVSWKTILLGVFLYTILGLIPFVGCLAQFLLVLGALGVITRIKLKILKEWR